MTNPKQKTLLLVAPYFPPHGGGLERYAFEIGKRLVSNHDWRVVVVTSGDHGRNDVKEVMEGVTVYRLTYSFKISNTPVSLSWFKKIRTILRTENPDIVNIHMPVPGIGDITMLVAGATPIVVTYHTGSLRKGKLIPDIFIWCYEYMVLPLLLKRANHIVCSSDFVRNDFLKGYARKSSTITPAVDFELFSPGEEKRKNWKEVLFVAGLGKAEQHKGLTYLIDAVKGLVSDIPNICLSIVGDGNMRSHYESYVEKNGLKQHVTFKGRLSGTALVEAYRSSDVVVLPSFMPAESFGMVLIEGMACKKPVIGTNMGGIPTIIRDGENGILVPQQDSLMLREAIRRILTNSDLALRLAEEGYEDVHSRFDWNVQSEKYSVLFQSLILDIQKPKKNVVMLASGTINSSFTYRILSIGRELVRRGYEVTIIAPTLDKYSNYKQETFTEIDGVHIERPFQFQFRHTELSMFPYIVSAAWKMLTLPVDIVYVYKPTPLTIVGLLAKFFRGVPVILDMDDLGSEVMKLEGNSSFRTTLVNWCERLTAKYADSIIVVSSYLLQVYKTKYPNKKVEWVPNGTDSILFSEQLSPQEEDCARIVMIGGINRENIIEPLIRALPHVTARIPEREIELRIIGDGSKLPYLKSLAEELGVSSVIRYLGWVEKSLLPKYVHMGDIGYCYMPDHLTTRACSNMKVFDYMALGITPLVSDVGDLPYYVDKGNAGYVVPAGDFKVLIDTLVNALRGNNDRLARSRAAADRAITLFDWSVLTDKVEKVLVGLL